MNKMQGCPCGWYGYNAAARLPGVIWLVSGTGFCAFCFSGVLPVGLIGPDLQQFKRKLHKKYSPAGWLWGCGLALAAALFRRAGVGVFWGGLGAVWLCSFRTLAVFCSCFFILCNER